MKRRCTTISFPVEKLSHRWKFEQFCPSLESFLSLNFQVVVFVCTSLLALLYQPNHSPRGSYPSQGSVRVRSSLERFNGDSREFTRNVTASDRWPTTVDDGEKKSSKSGETFLRGVRSGVDEQSKQVSTTPTVKSREQRRKKEENSCLGASINSIPWLPPA